jgi:hypothetical protein
MVSRRVEEIRKQGQTLPDRENPGKRVDFVAFGCSKYIVACHHARPARRADSTGKSAMDICIGERDAVFCKPVEMWCMHVWITRTPERIVTVVVGDYKYNILP